MDNVYTGLGEAAARGGTAEAEEYLRCGLATATRTRAGATALAVGRLQVRATRGAEAIVTLHGARARAQRADTALAARIDAGLVVAAHADRLVTRASDSPTARHRPAPRGTSREERARLASLAIRAADAGAEARLVHSLATRALA